MTLDAVIMAFGVFVAILSFLQLPPEWNTALFFIAGVVITGLGIMVRRRGARSSPPARSSPSSSSRFVDSQYSDDDHAEG
jgi:hypothetical protein